MKTLIKNVKTIIPYEIRENLSVLIEGKKIISIDEEERFSDEEFDQVIDGKGMYLSPGFIDLHNHGNYGHDTMEGTFEALRSMASFHAKNGITSFLATTVTDSYETIVKALKNGADYMEDSKGNGQEDVKATMLGFYLEGPYFSQEKKGAQPSQYIKEIDIPELKKYIDQSRNNIRIVALAPEKDKAKKSIEVLRGRGITVAAGHSNGTYEEIERSMDLGVTQATHLFNGMRSFSHREPGIIGAVLTDDRVVCEMICDGVHIHPVAMKMAVRLKGRHGIILISDAMMAAGLEDGDYNLGAHEVFVRNGEARLSDGTLAGSTLTLNRAVYNMVHMVNVPLYEAVHMASLNPARAIGLGHKKGSIEVGKDADLVIFNDDLEVSTVIIEGQVWQK